MKRFVTFVGLLLALVLPSHALAGTPYSFNWVMVQENPTCETAKLGQHNGDPFFNINGTPIPGYEVPGAFVTIENGWESNFVQGGFDSVLLRIGANELGFNVANTTGDDSCVHSQNVVTLSAPTLGIEKPLFALRRDGTAFSGSTQLDMQLEEINPQLAMDIAILEEEIANERKWLIANADTIEDLAVRLNVLQSLETEIGDLLTRPLDEITAEELDEILWRHSYILDEATREALKQVLADLKQSILDLQKELASLISNFGDQANAVSDFLTGDARQGGFSPDDPSNYGLGPNDVPWVDVPDISDVPGAWEAGKDPYAAYADAVIASLKDYVSGGVVIGRANFVAEVRAWRSNQAALEKAIKARVSVSQAEVNAFLNAQNKVTSYLQQFMDQAGWLHDANVPPDVRTNVDGVLKKLYADQAEQLKDRLNELANSWAPEVSNPFFDTVRAFSAGMSAIAEGAHDFKDVMQTIVHGATRIGIGFVPFAGPALDICEAVTGKEWCLPSGRKLSTEERILSGVGFGVGKIVKVWKGVSSAAISTEAKVAAAAIAGLPADVAELLKVARLKNYKGLVGAVSKSTSKIGLFEHDAARYLMKNQEHKMLGYGDEAVRKVLGIIEHDTPPLGQSFDFLSITKTGGLALSEVKAVTTGQVEVKHALSQLENGMRKLGEKNLAGSAERVQIIVPKGARLKGTYIPKPEGLFDTALGELVTMKNQGRPDLIVQWLEL